jgi:hypothetical protein
MASLTAQRLLLALVLVLATAGPAAAQRTYSIAANAIRQAAADKVAEATGIAVPVSRSSTPLDLVADAPADAPAEEPPAEDATPTVNGVKPVKLPAQSPPWAMLPPAEEYKSKFPLTNPKGTELSSSLVGGDRRCGGRRPPGRCIWRAAPRSPAPPGLAAAPRLLYAYIAARAVRRPCIARAARARCRSPPPPPRHQLAPGVCGHGRAAPALQVHGPGGRQGRRQEDHVGAPLRCAAPCPPCLW